MEIVNLQGLDEPLEGNEVGVYLDFYFDWESNTPSLVGIYEFQVYN
jgi:hypothetical protein